MVVVVVVCWKRERQLLEDILQKSSCLCLQVWPEARQHE